jgi:hypothetical protein
VGARAAGARLHLRRAQGGHAQLHGNGVVRGAGVVIAAARAQLPGHGLRAGHLGRGRAHEVLACAPDPRLHSHHTHWLQASQAGAQRRRAVQTSSPPHGTRRDRVLAQAHCAGARAAGPPGRSAAAPPGAGGQGEGRARVLLHVVEAPRKVRHDLHLHRQHALGLGLHKRAKALAAHSSCPARRRRGGTRHRSALAARAPAHERATAPDSSARRAHLHPRRRRGRGGHVVHDAAIWQPLDVQNLGTPRHRLTFGTLMRARSEHIMQRQLHLRPNIARAQKTGRLRVFASQAVSVLNS